MHYVRNLGRRKVRTSLTILGITIGIWALVVFGSMANKINALVEGGSSFYADKITLSDAGGVGGFSAAPMAISLADDVRAVDGVAAVAPSVMMLMGDQNTVSFGTPPMIEGTQFGADEGLNDFPSTLAQGRRLTADDETRHVTVLGSDIARKYDVKVGDSIDLQGVSFEVVGILEPTLTAPDQAAQVPLAAAQQLFVKSMPPVIQSKINPRDIATSMTVYPEPGQDTEVLATRIESQIANVTAMTGADFDQQIGSATSMLNSILIGIALISLLVGGLSVINTMAMSVAERTREIGIKRAIGGSRTRIVREFVIESALIGALGGLVGLGLGLLVVTLVNEASRSSGTVLFEMTLGTAVTAILFSTILGALAGLVPAVHASRLDPVTALRYE
jgi:putative ABC transport system permease protein